MWASARSFVPDINNCRVVTMEKDTSPLPGRGPGSAGDEDGIHLPPGNGVVAEIRGPWLTKPVASPEAPIAEVGGIGCKLHIWGQRPVSMEKEACAIPCREEVKPPVEALASVLRVTWWCRRVTVVLRSIKRHRKILPGGTTLQAKATCR